MSDPAECVGPHVAMDQHGHAVLDGSASHHVNERGRPILWTSFCRAAVFTGETESGWQTLTFSAPVQVTSGTTYVASYFAPRRPLRFRRRLLRHSDGQPAAACPSHYGRLRRQRRLEYVHQGHDSDCGTRVSLCARCAVKGLGRKRLSGSADT
ncbi:DUF4082 domain-containing protein [Sphaerisporangium sp. NPDC051011]|uniref:DUF4082 domain-containing protein n=1 Tax=Sphaerisporangium sp. NPDC051011 TaxID=3155792 RepID=UPI0033DD9AE8